MITIYTGKVSDYLGVLQREKTWDREGKLEMTSTSHTPAHESTTTVASFRTWRGSRCIVARGPAGATITTCDQQGGVHYPKAS